MNNEAATTSTKTLARELGLTTAQVNEAARDLRIASYEPARRTWTVPRHTASELRELLVG